MSDLEVIVVGGGIGGLCIAQALHGAGVRVAVYERDRAPDARLDRYRLHINPAGARSLQACLPPARWREFVATAGVPGGGFGFLNHRLSTLVVVEDSVMYPEEPWYPVDRATLRRLLLDGLDDVVHFDRTFDRYEVHPDGRVTAHFADGGTASGDVLVGADGASSRVRQQYLPHAERVDTGALGIGLKLPLTEQTRAWLPPRLAVGENLVLAPAPCFLFTSVFEAAEAYLLCAFVARRAAFPQDTTDLQRAILTMIARWHPDLRRLIAECDPDSIGQYPFLAAPRLTPWAASPVVLLGDAIHAMPPTGGLGANTALRDARLLARQLSCVVRGERSLLPAIAEYETEMREYGYAAVRTSLTTLRLGLIGNPVALAGMSAWFRLCAAVPAIRRMGFRNNWARDAQRRPWE